MALAGNIAPTIFCFTASWADFLYPLTLYDIGRPAGAAARHRQHADQGRVFNWADHDRGAARRGAAVYHLRFLMDYYIPA
ncbi:MAG TPA: hypothetical protein VFC56_01010 [Stellaceae bacterium]|nr:hypothetical protein [Stellaceae bacterium]